MDFEKNKIVQLPLEQLMIFPEHHFKVCNDKLMQQLMESMRTVGIFSPIMQDTIIQLLENWLRLRKKQLEKRGR